MNDQALIQLALDALENHTAIKHPQQRAYRDDAIDALRARLAQHSEMDAAIAAGDGTLHGAIDYWQKKAMREWKGLTSAERKTLWNLSTKPMHFAELVEAKLREKNA